MKKVLLIVSSTLLLANAVMAQEPDTDKKFRLGLKVAAQPCWFASNEKSTSRLGAGFGFGFGLVTEFRLGRTASFVTGIGGDFENGGIKYKYDPTAVSRYSIDYLSDNSGNVKELKDNTNEADLIQSGDTYYIGIYERRIKTTHISIPIGLKMMTKEIAGFKYFGVFGGEVGIRIKARATDKYTSSINAGNVNGTGPGTNSNVNIYKDGSLIPLRVGMNVGLGVEYRLAGSTSAFLSVNFFHSFTNLMRNESKFLIYDYQKDSSGSLTFFRQKNDLLMNAIRINLGVLF